jgi:hypothetical protein
VWNEGEGEREMLYVWVRGQRGVIADLLGSTERIVRIDGEDRGSYSVRRENKSVRERQCERKRDVCDGTWEV